MLHRVRGISWMALAVAAWLLAGSGCQRSDSPAAAGGVPAEVGKDAVVAAPAEPAAAFEKIRGRWLRPDGGYVLAIESIDADGRAEAHYFNPRPIRVAWARAHDRAGKVGIEVELRDVNYPGCLYKLEYVPGNDRLVGTYFQAQMQETHEVFFLRQP